MSKNALYTEVANWLQNQIIDKGDFDFADNYRIAEVDDEEAVTRYEEQRADGCCGFYDRKINFKGTWFFVGFNYGH